MGSVYVISNSSMPGLLKIGYTNGDIQTRLTQLQTTGVPTPFQIELLVHAEDAFELEQSLHRIFRPFRYGKEFFQISANDAAKAIKDYLIQHDLYDHQRLSGRAHRYQSKLEVSHIDKTLNAQLIQSIKLDSLILRWYDYIESTFSFHVKHNPNANAVVFHAVSAVIEPFPVRLGPWVWKKHGLICTNTLFYLPFENITGEFTHVGVLPKTKILIHLMHENMPEQFNSISRYRTFEGCRGPAEIILKKSKNDRVPKGFDTILEVYGGSADTLILELGERLSGKIDPLEGRRLCWRSD